MTLQQSVLIYTISVQPAGGGVLFLNKQKNEMGKDMKYLRNLFFILAAHTILTIRFIVMHYKKLLSLLKNRKEYKLQHFQIPFLDALILVAKKNSFIKIVFIGIFFTCMSGIFTLYPALAMDNGTEEFKFSLKSKSSRMREQVVEPDITLSNKSPLSIESSELKSEKPSLSNNKQNINQNSYSDLGDRYMSTAISHEKEKHFPLAQHFSKLADENYTAAEDYEIAKGIHDLEQEQQLLWAKSYESATSAIPPANTTINLTTNFQQMSLNSRPHPEQFHLYIRSDEDSGYQLVKSSGAPTFKLIRLYGPTKEGKVNYATISQPHLTKETLTHPRNTNDKFPGGESRPTKKSSSYSEGCNTYHYTLPSGETIRFDRGHGTAHADTIKHNGLISTKDPENFVPQNQIYNHPVRRDLEDRLRKKGLIYKELSIYHRDCNYLVRAQVRGKSKNFRIPIPEGFIFLALNKNSEIQEAYYFPNFVLYDKIFSGQSGTQCAYFSNLYKITNLTDWFWNPGVTIGDVSGHQDQVDLADFLAKKLLSSAPTFFQHLSEQQMPPKARVALLVTLLEWNMQAAASLEFFGLQQQINLVHFYTVPRIFYELDDRYDADKKLAIKTFLANNSVSEEARNLVNFLSEHAEFSTLQDLLQQLTAEIEKIMKCDPTYWQNAQTYLNHPVLYEFFAASKQDLKKIQVGSHEHQFSISRLNPTTDLEKFNVLIGGFNVCDLSKARSVLTIVETRAQHLGTTIAEKLHFLRLYQDKDRLPDEVKKAEWEEALCKQASDDKKTTLLEKRKMADFYGTRNLDKQKAYWLNQLVTHLEQEPTRENFWLIVDWCLKTTGAFLQCSEEAQEMPGLRASTPVALLIWRGLATSSVELENALKLESDIAYDLHIVYQCFLKGEIDFESILEPLIDDEYLTGDALRKIFKLFLTKKEEFVIQ